MTVNDLTTEVKAIALTLMEGLACPRSVMVAILIRYKEWDQVANLRTDPSQYSDSEDYWAANAATEFLRKYEALPTGIKTAEVAIQKWMDSEKQCKLTNDRLDPYLHPYFRSELIDERMEIFFSLVRKEVFDIVGACPPKQLENYFGPGATLSDKSRFVTVADKMSSAPTLTPDAWIHVRSWMETKWAQAQAALGNELSLSRGNHFFTVKKDATTDRGCGKEPSLNVSYQLSLGKALRRRLLYSGIDLEHGQFIHRQVACAGSFTGGTVTIDLSSASDTVATNLVKLVFPEAWFQCLRSLRSPMTRLPDGRWFRLEKFSSMGNGYTFELETTIFVAIARAVHKMVGSKRGYECMVYGDDIIAPLEHSDTLIAALRFCGFTPNERKTFTAGSFRESCGGDYFCGVPVRAHYLKEPPNEPQHFISLANGIRRLAKSQSFDTRRWACLIRAWFCCLDNIPSNVRSCRGPEGLGDTVIHDDEVRWSSKTEFSIRYIRTYSPVSFRRVRWEGFGYDVQFAVALYLAGKGTEKETRDPEGNLRPRDAVTGHGVCWTPYS